MTSTIGMGLSSTTSPARTCVARQRDLSVLLFSQPKVLAVHDVHDVVVPANHFGFDQVLVDVEVERHEWMVAQQETLGVLQQLGTFARVDLHGRGANQ